MKLTKPPNQIEPPWRPTREQLAAATTRSVRDLVAPALRVLFVGINPGLYSAAIGHHFGRPGNRFWPAMHAGGFTPRLFSPFEERRLLDLGYGITNLVDRATATADQLTRDELRRGARRLTRKVLRLQPRFVAIIGLTAYRTAFTRPRAMFGRQDELIGNSIAWVLPNPSGLNAHYQPAALGKLFAELQRAVGATPGANWRKRMTM